MGTLDEVFELRHAFIHVLREVRIDIVIVRDGVGRTGFAFGDGRIILFSGRMSDDAGVPYVRRTQVHEGLERTLVDIDESAATVLFLAAVMLACLVVVGKQTREELVNYGFVHSCVFFCGKMCQ